MAGLGGLASRFPRLSFASIIVRRVARCLPFMAWRWLVIQVVASMIFFTVLLSWNGLSISSSRATAPSGSGFYSAKRAELQSRHALRHREDNGTLQDDEHWIFYAKSLIAQVKARMRYWESTAGAFLFEPGWVDDDERIPLPPHAPHRLRCSECVGTPMFDYHKAFMAIVTDKLRFRCDVRRKEPLEHAQYLLTRKNERRVISLGLYGGDPRYVHGLYRNVELMTQILPFWRMRLYYDTASVPPAHAARFERMGYAARIRKAVLCVGRSVELVKMKAKTSTSTEGMFWRFLIADDTDVARYIVRDSDSRISKREAMAIDEWILSGKKFHSIRDHPSHSHFPLNGGMWGGTHNSQIAIGQKISIAPKTSYGHDLAFLAALYSFMEKDLLAHDAFSCSNCPATGGGPCAGTGRPYHSSVPFPSVRAGKEHVGARFTHEDVPVNGDDIVLMLSAPPPIQCIACYPPAQERLPTVQHGSRPS